MPLVQATRRGLLRPFVLSVTAAVATAHVFAQSASSPHTASDNASAAEQEELAAIRAAASLNDDGASAVPADRGFNATLVTSSQHDSTNGWSSIVFPGLAYRFNRYFSVDASAPIYDHIQIYTDIGTAAKSLYAYKAKTLAFGDTTLTLEGDALSPTLAYTGTFSFGMPSGRTDYGLGAGQVTYSFDNRFEKDFGVFMPDLELGFGDSSSLVDQQVVKSYIAVGPMAHFQAGGSVALLRDINFEADAYEELPLATNIVYSTTGKGKKKVTTSTNEDPGEDNGFLTSLDIPLSPHITLSGFYSRSLRDRADVAGFSFTLLLKAPPREQETTH